MSPGLSDFPRGRPCRVGASMRDGGGGLPTPEPSTLPPEEGLVCAHHSELAEWGCGGGLGCALESGPLHPGRRALGPEHCEEPTSPGCGFGIFLQLHPGHLPYLMTRQWHGPRGNQGQAHPDPGAMPTSGPGRPSPAAPRAPAFKRPPSPTSQVFIVELRPHAPPSPGPHGAPWAPPSQGPHAPSGH